MGSYLTEIEKAGIEPNFYCSAEYLARSGAVERTNEDYMWLEDPEGALLFPALRWCWSTESNGFFTLSGWAPEGKEIWSDFAGPVPFAWTNGWERTALDTEYIYNPEKFQAMEGKKWKTFRKNCRKWPRRNPGGTYHMVTKDRNGANNYQPGIENLLLDWLTDKGVSTIYDGDVLLDFVVNGFNRAVLVHPKKGVVGVNVWDYSSAGVNFRYSIARPGEDFLSDYLRWLFYTCPLIRRAERVNDGGCLGIPELDRYKRGLNPTRIRTVYTWRKR